MNAPRVAIVFRGIGDIGGTNNTIADHARALTQLGYDVDLIGEKIHKGGVTPDMGRGVRIRRLPLLKSRRWHYFARAADRHVASQRYDFVAGHGHNVKQHVVSMHNCLDLAHEAIHGTALPPDDRSGLADIHDAIFASDRFAFCICNSRLMQADIAWRYGVSPERLPIIYPGYRPEQFNTDDRARYRESVRAELNCENELLIGLITSGDFKKRGLDLLIAAYAKVDPRLREKTRLLVLGKQGGNQAFIDQARAAGVADRMIFVGATREPQRYFHALDMCVHPARVEEFGQVVQEAMACGIPVLSTQAVGSMEQLPSRWYDALAKRPEPLSLSQEIETYLCSADKRSALAEAGHAAVRLNTKAANIAATLALYRSAGMPEPAPAEGDMPLR